MKIERLAGLLPEEAWATIPTGEEDSGERRPWEWACLELSVDSAKGMRRWLLIRRSPEDPEDLAFYQAYGPEETPTYELVKVCQRRWRVEDCFAEAKGEVGLDHYELRRWDAWHRYVTLCLLAHAFLAVTRLAARDEEEEADGKKGILRPSLSR
jgi:SRSO17 transposase